MGHLSLNGQGIYHMWFNGWGSNGKLLFRLEICWSCFSHPPEAGVTARLSARMEELKTVKKENRKRRKVIEAYQEMMSAGATGLHAVSC